MEYRQHSSVFPNWRVVIVSTPTEEDDAFFAELATAAQEAERKFGPALAEKYGPRMPRS